MDPVSRWTVFGLGVLLGLLGGIYLGGSIGKLKAKWIDWRVFLAAGIMFVLLVVALASWLDDAVKVAAASTALFAAAGSWYSGMIATRSVYDAAERQRAVNTLQLLMALESKDFVDLRQQARKFAGDQPDNAEKEAAYQVLNRLEDVATLVNRGLLDERIARASLRSWVVSYWELLPPHLDPKELAIYDELPKLYADWKRGESRD